MQKEREMIVEEKWKQMLKTDTVKHIILFQEHKAAFIAVDTLDFNDSHDLNFKTNFLST